MNRIAPTEKDSNSAVLEKRVGAAAGQFRGDSGLKLKTPGIHPRRASGHFVDYKNDPGNGYAKPPLCFLQLVIVSHRTNNDTRHLAFNADERFLPIDQFADEANQQITHLAA